MTTLQTTLPDALGYSAPVTYADFMVRAGMGLRADFTDPRCHPAGVITSGAVPNSASGFKDLQEPARAFAWSSAPHTSVASNGSLVFAGTSPSGQLTPDQAGWVSLAVTPREILWTLWMILPTDPTTGNYWSPMGNGSSINGSSIYLDMGVGGLTPRIAIAGPSSSPSLSAPAPLALNTLHCIGGHWRPGERFALWVDGVEVAALTSGVPATLNGAANGGLPQLRSVGKFTCPLISVMDVAAALAGEIADDWPDDRRFSVAQHMQREWAYGRGLLADAPRAALA